MRKFIIFLIIVLSLFSLLTTYTYADTNAHFGIVVNPYEKEWENPDRITNLLKELGVKLVITKLSWNDIEPEKGKFSKKGLAKFDDLVNKLTGLGIEIMPYISATPGWAIDPKLSPANWKGKKFGPPAKNPEDLASFFAHVVKRYKGKIKFWALYNAPQNRNHWTEPGVLADMYKLARQVLNKEQPDGKLVLSGLEGAKSQGIPYLENFLKAGGGKYVDMYDFHMHLGGDLFTDSENNTIQYKKVLSKHGELSKPIQYGAIGLPSQFNPSKQHIAQFKWKGWKPLDYAPMTPEKQANVLVTTMILGRSLGVERIFWTRTRDNAPASGQEHKKYMEKIKGRKPEWIIETEASRTRGIVNYDYSPKLAFAALKVLIQKLDKANVFKTLNLGDDGKGVVFKDNDKFIGVFFAWEGTKTITLKASAKSIKVFDIYGKEKDSVPVKDGKFVLKISPDPIYVEGNPQDLDIIEPK
jgi:hypothetical protein